MKSLALKTALAGALLGLTAGAALADGMVQNPYSPAYDHPYRHGVIPTREVHQKMKDWDNGQKAVNHAATGADTLYYGGGTSSGSQGNVGVANSVVKVYIVFYGSGWGTQSTNSNGDAVFSGDPDGAAQTAVSFYAGWGGGATADTPDTLELTLDRHTYNSGNTAKVHFSAKFDGTATLAVVNEGVRALKTIDVSAGDNDVEMPVKAGWGTGAYMLALVHRPLDTAAKRLPGRALGLAWFGIDEAAHKLGLELLPPEKARPRGQLDIPVKLLGLEPGQEAYVTVAAVDVGSAKHTALLRLSPQRHRTNFIHMRHSVPA